MSAPLCVSGGPVPQGLLSPAAEDVAGTERRPLRGAHSLAALFSPCGVSPPSCGGRMSWRVDRELPLIRIQAGFRIRAMD